MGMKTLLSLLFVFVAFVAQAANPAFTGFRGSGVILITTNPALGTVTSAGQPYILTNGQSTAVGFGTATPSAQFEVKGEALVDASRTMLRLTDTTALAAGIGGGFTMGGVYNAGGSMTLGAGIKAAKANATSENWEFDLVFLARQTGSGDASEYVRIRGDTGNFGIGTNAPASKLQVTGDGSQNLLWQAGTTAKASLSTLDTNGVHRLAYGTLYASNSVAMPTAAALGLGSYWVGNSNGFLVTIYTLNGSSTAMKVLAP